MDNKLKRPIVIKNDRLYVEIEHPGTWYKGSRFDWTGFITKIIFDSKHSFCTSESLTPGQGSGGGGLCNEFGINTPIGYNEAKPGDKFPKIGTGLLTRPDETDYFFFDKYDVSPFDIRIATDYNTAVFKSEPSECNGYAFVYKKSISVESNILTIDYYLENIGSKQITTEEYCHNFISVDNNFVGPGYILKFPYEIKLDGIPEIMDLKDNELHFNKQPEKDFYCRPLGFSSIDQHYWELNFTPQKVGVREYSNFPVQMVAVWGTTHVVSPEVFIGINLAPGEKQEWSRKYEFLNL